MSNIFFNSKQTWPAITDDVRVSVYSTLDLNTPIASIQQNAPHIDQQFSFPGLPRMNFVYKIFQVETNGTTIISQLGQASFVAANDELQYKKPVLIQVGVSPIPGATSGGTDASTIETNYVGNPDPSSWAFTLKGYVQAGAIVNVDFNWDNSGGDPNPESVTSTVLSGWSLSDLIADLKTKMSATSLINDYTDTDSFDGLKVFGVTTASGTVTITNTESTAGEVIWPHGVSTVNVPDWIGWDLEASGRVGQYPFKRDSVQQIDINWNVATADLSLQQTDDIFQDGEYLYFEFQPLISQSSGGVGTGTTGAAGFSDIKVITTNTTLLTSDIGKKILIAPSGNYLEIILPDYTDVAANNITYFEMVDSASKCAVIIAASGNDISWLDGDNVYIKPNETFELYKRVVSTGVYEWRIQNAVGNFSNVGEIFYSDLSPDKIFNAIELDGSNTDIEKEARLYNRFVIRNGLAISYASWSSSNIFTRMKFSLKDSGSNNFRIPDLNTTPIYMRPRGINSVGDYLAGQLLAHQHLESLGTEEFDVSTYGRDTVQQSLPTYGDLGGSGPNLRSRYADLTSRSVVFNTATGLWEIIDGSENRPNSRATRCYIKT